MKINQKYIDSEGFNKPIVLKALGKDSKSFASLTKNQHLKSQNKEIKSNLSTVKYIFAGAQWTNAFTENRKYYCGFGKEKPIECKVTSFEKIPHFYTFEKKEVRATAYETQFASIFFDWNPWKK